MDFHSLTRKELQALCKRNKIPANLTNLAMADSLSALHHVEGIEEFLNQSQSDSQKCSEETVVIGSPNVPRTACRTLTRRKPVAREEPESSRQPLTRTRRATRRGVAEEEAAEQERDEGVPPKTPAVPSSNRKSAAPVSVRKETEISSVPRAYSTRRSVRLLEKTLENLSLEEDVKIQPMKIEGVSEESMTECLERSDRSSEKEVSSEMTQTESKDRGSEVEEDSKSKSELVDLVATADEKTDVEAETLVEQEIGSGPVADLSVEIQNSNSKDFGARRDLGMEDSLAVEILDEVSSVIIDQDIAPETCSARQEEKKESVEMITLNPSSDYAVQPAAELESESLMNLASEESSKPKILAAEISNTPASNGNGGSEEESLSKANAVEAEVPSFEAESDESEESFKPEILTVKPLAEILVNDYAGSEEGCLSKDNAVKAEVSNFESESEDNSSEEESEESEASDVDSEDYVASEESDSESSLVDVNVDKFESKEALLETSLVVQAEEKNRPCLSEDDSSEEESAESEASNEEEYMDSDDDVESEESDSEASLVDVNVDKLETLSLVQAEENNSPHQSGAKIALPVPPFAADQLSGQFPRPTLPTPSKSSSKKNHPVIQMITDALDENEEEIDGCKNDNEANKDKNCSDDNNNNFTMKLCRDKSLRQLQKMLKQKLQIENNKKVEKTRVALQTLPENQLAVDEPLK